MRTIKSLTGLRFVAALIVFVFHANMPYTTPLTFLPEKVLAVINQGYLGVTMFFVLSGLVLTYSYLKTPSEKINFSFAYIKDFLFKRFARIYPVYITGLLLCLALEIYLNQFPDPLIILTSAFLIQSYFPFLAMQWYDGGGWSVVNEFFFYLMFPFVMPILIRINQKSWLFVLLALTIFSGSFLGLVYDGVIPSPFRFPYSWAYWFPPFRFNEFLAGVLAGILVFKFNWKVPGLLALLFCAISIIYLSIAGPLLPITVAHNWIIVPTIVLLLATLSQPKPIFFKWLELPVFQYLGQVSYCFYIMQMPSLTVFSIVKKIYIFTLPNWQIAIILFF